MRLSRRRKKKRFVPATTATTTSSNARSCTHWQDIFKLENGLEVLVSAFMDRPGYWINTEADRERAAMTVEPDIGFYLDSAWAKDHTVTTPGWKPAWVQDGGRTKWAIYPWSDGMTPASTRKFLPAARWLLKQLKRGKVVETGCLGAHGRTGTLLASLLILQGVEPWTAIDRVRKTYCSWAIETSMQERFLYDIWTDATGHEQTANLPETTPRRLPASYGTPYYNTALPQPDLVTAASEKVLAKRTADSEEEYEEWLKLNYIGNLRNQADDVNQACGDPPCSMPNECNPIEGDCFKATVNGTATQDPWDRIMETWEANSAQEYMYEEGRWCC